MRFRISSRAGHLGPRLSCGTRVPLVLYADDFALISMGSSASQGMHALLALVDEHNAATGMRANTSVGKTELVIFGVSSARRSQLQLETFYVGGQAISHVPEYKYLGIMHHESRHWGADLELRHAKAQRSLGAMHGNLVALEATKSVALAFRMHDVCVRTVQTYGSGVWATSYNAVSPAQVARNLLESGHLQFMRRWCRLRQNVPVWAIYAELGRLPLHYYWWREVVRLWNSIVALPEGSVWHEILRDNLIDQHCRRKNWAGQVLAFLRAIGHVAGHGSLELAPLDVDQVLRLLLQRYGCVWESLPKFPRLASSQVHLATYYNWVFRGEWLDRPAYLFLNLSYRQTYTFVGFKLGCHRLPIETGRWDGTPRLQRICQRCEQGALDDERHLVFECPAFEHLRVANRPLFGQEVGFDMRRFFAHADQRAVVMYILDCLRLIGLYASVGDGS